MGKKTIAGFILAGFAIVLCSQVITSSPETSVSRLPYPITHASIHWEQKIGFVDEPVRFFIDMKDYAIFTLYIDGTKIGGDFDGAYIYRVIHTFETPGIHMIVLKDAFGRTKGLSQVIVYEKSLDNLAQEVAELEAMVENLEQRVDELEQIAENHEQRIARFERLWRNRLKKLA